MPTFDELDALIAAPLSRLKTVEQSGNTHRTVTRVNETGQTWQERVPTSAYLHALVVCADALDALSALRDTNPDRDAIARILAESNGTPWDYHKGGADENDPYYRDADALIAAGFGTLGDTNPDEWEERERWSGGVMTVRERRRKAIPAGPWLPVPSSPEGSVK